MKTLKVTTLNSIYIVAEDDDGSRKVTDILIPNGGNYRDVHYFIKDKAPKITEGPELGRMMWSGGDKLADTWHTSLIQASEEIPTVVGNLQQ